MKMFEEWLKAAKIDIDSVEYLIRADHLTSTAAFHSQQAIEKTLKSILEFKGNSIPKIHSLNTLF